MSKEDDPQIHEIIDDSMTQLAKTLEEYMRKNEASIAQERSDFYTPQIQELETQLKEHHEEFLRMQSNASEATGQLVQKEAILMRMIQLSSKLQSKVRNGNSMSRAFNGWVIHGTDTEILEAAFKNTFLKNAVKRLMFKRWIRKMYKKREIRFTREIKTRFEKESKAKAAESNRIIEELESELNSAKTELETKQKSFLEMQQRLRKAFMRGVVNLNLEAMDVFNGAQFMNLMQEVEGNETEEHENEDSLNESDDEFFVEEEPQINVIRHQ